MVKNWKPIILKRFKKLDPKDEVISTPSPLISPSPPAH